MKPTARINRVGQEIQRTNKDYAFVFSSDLKDWIQTPVRKNNSEAKLRMRETRKGKENV